MFEAEDIKIENYFNLKIIMTEVTTENFNTLFPTIQESLKNATLIAIDTEFTGINIDNALKESLFDTPEERYLKLKESIRPFVVIQFGLTALKYIRDENKYVADVFYFYLFPQCIPTRNRHFMWQASCIEFLTAHDFDFNKVAYNGISYLNQEEEVELQCELQQNKLMRCVQRLVSYKDEDELKAFNNKVFDWINSGTSPYLEIETPTPLLQYLAHKELRNHFLNIWTKSKGKKISITKVSEDMRKMLQEEEGNELDKKLLDAFVGFSKVFKLLVNFKKPIIGHNLLLDLMYMYQQLHRPLPKKYSDFKTNIHKLFPIIFDTKLISYELKNILKTEDTTALTSLATTYIYFKEQRGRHLALCSPLIELSETVKAVQNKYHDAGWDSYCTGYCFIKMAHVFATNKLGKGSELKPLTNLEIIGGVKNFENCVNIIRGSIPYMRFDGPDPDSTRPEWLYVQSARLKTLNVSQITEMFSTFGSVDVKLYTPQRALVAVNNHGSARDILQHFRTHKDFQVAPYSLLRHSNITKIFLWSGVFISGGITAWLLRRNFQKS